ncbi:OmpA family protein [Flavobacterium alkalisoli]|uniref:OmpA family protein n=1 Tax=Flavobacterium alkalisoli TaxID=2602769 RepID=A0A5B9FYE3_9FLAO|nr:OmpA family protein [Flavobacterium alkalisoli]QEE49767.1 OmpA family protein [Flavobacterium alkalisoli]
MKKLYIAVGLLMALQGYSQSKETLKADALFENSRYTVAIEEYLQLANSNKADAYVYKQLADSYYAVFNMDEAAKWYAKAVETKQDAETYYRYAVALKTQGKYAEANKQMDTFAAMMPNDQRAVLHKANPDYIPSLNSQNKMFDATALDVNSKDKGDFGAVLSNDNILYFVSARNTSATDDYGQPYIDIFSSVKNADGSFSEAVAVSELNTRFHDGPVAVSAEGNTVYFARDGHAEGQYTKGKKVKLAQIGLYKATKVDGKWQNITALPFNSTSYSVGSPSLSADGKTLYFASNMPGGLGDTDIWKINVNSDGTYGIPVNLGKDINTPGKENFPFITDDNILYFSSVSRPGYGGFDIFKADLTKGGEAVNLGKPINSEKDDFSFSFNTKQNVGYFSSNRSGVDNIYTANPVCRVEALTTVTDVKTGKVLADAKVAILDNAKNSIETKQTGTDGKASYDVECDTDYVLEVSKTGYEPATIAFAKTGEKIVMVEAALRPVNELIKETHIELADINFEFGKSNITREGAKELDKLVEIMNDYPEMVILVKSHTDTKGSADFNMKLSEKRAQATVSYVISKGISKDRISGKGYGESEPKVNCGEKCTDEQNAQNRRSEFLIVKK